MPIDASIISQLKVPESIDPTAGIAKAMTLASTQQRLQEQQLETDTKQSEFNDKAAIDQAIKMYPDKLDDAVDWLEKNGNGRASMTLRKGLYDQRKSFAENETARLNQTSKALGMLGDAATELQQASKTMTPEEKDQAWQHFVGATSQYLGKDYAARLGQKFDDRTLGEAIGWGGKMKDSLAIQAEATKNASEAIDLDDKGLKSTDAWKKSMAYAFSLAGDQQHWDAVYSQYLQGIPTTNKAALTALSNDFGPKWSKETQQYAHSAALTAAEQQNASNAEATRAETQRHNKETEKTSRSNQTRLENTYGDKETPAQKDERELPSDVKKQIGLLPVKYKTRKSAMAAMQDLWPDLLDKFPGMDPKRVNETFDAIYGKPNATSGLLDDEDAPTSLGGKLPDKKTLTAAQKQKALMDEFDNPATTPARRAAIQNELRKK